MGHAHPEDVYPNSDYRVGMCNKCVPLFSLSLRKRVGVRASSVTAALILDRLFPARSLSWGTTPGMEEVERSWNPSREDRGEG